MNIKSIGRAVLNRIKCLYDSVDRHNHYVTPNDELSCHLNEKNDTLLKYDDLTFTTQFNDTLNQKKITSIKSYEYFFKPLY